AGQSVKAWDKGYRVLGGVGNTTVVKLVAPAGRTFLGWNTKADGSGTAYAAGDRIADEQMSDLTLYAQWSASGAAPLIDEYAEEIVEVIEEELFVDEVIE
ncbi:MAG: InlB B-repeat-containing protein, partial [Firmicutes bacterium]|nr:InlB B-repeat-containing protein [Bacillota bacterium]